MAWCFADESCVYADKILNLLTDEHSVCVPAIWSLEVANILAAGERAKRITEAGILYFLEQLSYLSIHVEHHTHAHCFSSVLALARTHKLSAYDAAYLDLAIRRGLPIATLDKKLTQAAEKAKIKIL
jgi:predicted nucleic acid-binding protein